MAKKKKEAKVENRTFVLGYDINWMKEIGEEHPDYKKVMKEARKKKFIK